MSSVNDQPVLTLGSTVAAARRQAKLSSRALAERVGTTHSQIIRLESGQTAQPNQRLVARIADVLAIDIADLYAVAGWQPARGLPSFAPYLRSKYRGLPAAAHAEMQRSFDQIAQKYGYDAAGPDLGEDEIDKIQ